MNASDNASTPLTKSPGGGQGASCRYNINPCIIIAGGLHPGPARTRSFTRVSRQMEGIWRRRGFLGTSQKFERFKESDRCISEGKDTCQGRKSHLQAIICLNYRVFSFSMLENYSKMLLHSMHVEILIVGPCALYSMVGGSRQRFSSCLRKKNKNLLVG